MKTRTQGILLWYIRHGETSIIAHFYTREYGRQAFIFKRVKGKKSRHKFPFFQPLAFVELFLDYRQKKEIYSGNGAQPLYVFQSIPFQQVKNSITFFLAEFLSKVLQIHEGDVPLFEFLKTSILFLDQETTRGVNFHLIFLVKLTEFLGIQVDVDVPAALYLNIETGTFTAEPTENSFTQEQSMLWKKFQIDDWQVCDILPLSRDQRNVFLGKVLQYYSYHLHDFNTLKSLSVLQELFD